MIEALGLHVVGQPVLQAAKGGGQLGQGVGAQVEERRQAAPHKGGEQQRDRLRTPAWDRVHAEHAVAHQQLGKVQHQTHQQQRRQRHQPEHLGGANRERGRLSGEDQPEHADQTGADQGIGDQHQAAQQPGVVAAADQHQQLAQGGEATEGRKGDQAGGTAEEGQAHQRALAPQSTELGEVLGNVGEHDRADHHQHQGHRQRVDQHQVVGHRDAAEAHGHEQQAHPAGHQERQGSLDIHLGKGDQGADDGRGAAHHHQHRLHQRHHLDQGLEAQQHPGTADDHHRVAQHRGRQRTLHGFIQPQVQRDLGALAHRTGDQRQHDQRKGRRQGDLVVGLIGGPGLQTVEIPGAGERQQRDDAGQQDQVADPLGEKRVAGTLDHKGLVVPGANDQIGAQGEQLQDHVAEEQRIGEHQGAEAGLEEAERAEEARPAPVHLEIGDRIDLHQHMQARDHGHRDQGGLGDQAVDADAQPGRLQPGPAEGERPVNGRRAGAGIGVQGHQGGGAVHEGDAAQQQVDVTAGARAGAGDQSRRPQQ